MKIQKIRTGSHSPYGTITVTLILVGLATACSGTPQNTPVPPAVTLVSVVATPNPTATLAATVVPTAAPTPTAFVTAPPAGSAAVLPILMYHHLADLAADATELDKTWTVSPAAFRAQMKLLTDRGFHSVSMPQLVAFFKQGKPLPDKPIVISFDDGWEEQYKQAYPALKQVGLIGTFFVYTKPIDHAPYMTWDQLKEMSASGMDVEAHTLTHPHLRTIAPDQAEKEITDSKSVLEKQLGKTVVALSYPFGEYDAAVVAMVKGAGFQSAVSLNPGYRQRVDELFMLHRIRVSYNDTLEDFAARLPK